MANNAQKKSKTKWFIIGGAVLVLLIFIIANLTRSGEATKVVSADKVEQGDIISLVTASGKVKAKTEVDISANVSAKIVELPVKEGQAVTKGQLLVQLDPVRYQAAVDQYRASLASAQAQAELAAAQLEEASLAYDRAKKLHENKLISDEAYDQIRTTYNVQRAQHNAAEHSVERARASLREARNQLEYTTISSPIDGTVTALNAEVGEIVIIGTMNNPGTVIMTVSDLSEIEVEVEVDETDVANVDLDQKATVELDALPDTTFKGIVTEVGNSAQVAGLGTTNQVTNFMVTVLMQETVPAIRPGMSATCDITTAEADDVVKVPIGAVVLRDEKEIEKQKAGLSGSGTNEAQASEGDESDGETDEEEEESRELEGVFVIEDGHVKFVEVVTGIADQQDIEIISGLEKDQQIVTGSFRMLRELEHGDAVKIKD